MTQGRVQHRSISGVHRIRLAGGLLDLDDANELSAALEASQSDAALRLVVLESAGPDFCSGRAEGFDPLATGVDPTIALATIAAPIVAVLQGAVRSVGLEIALAADIRLAARSASFSLPDLSHGRLPCWGGTQRLTRLAGPSLATRMLLLAEEVGGDEAEEAGLVHEAVADETLATRAEEVCADLLGLGPLALQYAKEAVLGGSDLSIWEGLRLEANLNVLLQASSDRKEGLRAFFERRPPEFTGR